MFPGVLLIALIFEQTHLSGSVVCVVNKHNVEENQI